MPERAYRLAALIRDLREPLRLTDGRHLKIVTVRRDGLLCRPVRGQNPERQYNKGDVVEVAATQRHPSEPLRVLKILRNEILLALVDELARRIA